MTPDAGSILDAAAVLRELLRPLQERIDEQDARLKALEQRPIGVIDAGVWKPGQSYPKAVGVTFAGAYWVSQQQTAEQPGDGSPAWRMALHRGKPGRQGPPCRCAERERVAS